MTRTILTIASAILAASTLVASQAQACISCNYVPEVVHTPSPNHGYPARKRIAVKEHAIPAKPRIVKSQVAEKKRVAAKKVDIAKAPAAKETKVAEAAKPATETSEPATQVADLGCRKFIATVGTTVSVPCE